MDNLSMFFFFQAEDGIRDGTVTGVQTCALPIYEHRERHHTAARARHVGARLLPAVPQREGRVGEVVLADRQLGGRRGPAAGRACPRSGGVAGRRWRPQRRSQMALIPRELRRVSREGRDGFRCDTVPARRQDRRRSRLARRVILAIGVYLALAYLVLPTFWRHYEQLPPMADTPKFSRAPNGLPGDPLNVALVGGEAEDRKSVV